MEIYDPQHSNELHAVHNHVATNYKILQLIYNFKVVDEVVTDNGRIVTWDHGIKEYMEYFDGMLVYHRIGGPAIESHDNNFISYYIHGGMYIYTKEYCAACEFDDETTMMWVLKYGDDLPYF